MDCPDIVIVESEPGSSDVVAEAFVVKGFAVETAASVDAAARMIRTCPPGLVIGSITLTGENFLAFCRTLKHDADIPDIPVLVILPEQARYEPGYGESYGIVDALVQPLDLGKLIAVATRWVTPSRSSMSAKPAETPETPPTETAPEPKAAPPLPFDRDVPPTENRAPEAAARGSAERDALASTDSPARRAMAPVWSEDDPAAKLARDLEQASGMKRRNRFLAVVSGALAVAVLAALYFLKTGEAPPTPLPETRPETSVTEERNEPVSPSVSEPGRSVVDETSETAVGTDRSLRTPPKDMVVPSTGPVYRIQVGAFGVLRNADKLAANLREKGYEVHVRERTRRDGSPLHRVLAGAYRTRREAMSARDALADKEGIRGIVVRR